MAQDSIARGLGQTAMRETTSAAIVEKVSAALPSLGAPFYADTAAGLAATSSGEFFQVPGDGVTSFSLIYKNNAGVAELTATSPAVAVAQATAADSYRVGAQFSSIDATVEGAILFDGTASYPNKLGVNNAKPTDEPAWGTRVADGAYVAGGADVSGILGGYDNVQNALAAFIMSQHSIIYTTADHSAVCGGSLHTVDAGATYAFVGGGSSNRVGQNAIYSALLGGDQNKALGNATLANAAFRTFIGPGTQNTSNSPYGAILNGTSNTTGVAGDATRNYATVLNGSSNTASGQYAIASGASCTASAAYAWAVGNAVTVSGTRSWGFGDTITVAYEYAQAFGFRPVAPFHGSRVFSARQRGNNAGYNQELRFCCSNETTDATATRLSVYGASTYPTCPAETHIVGTFHVAGVDSAGNIAAWTITFGCKKAADGTTPVQGAAPTVTQLYDGIGVAAAPSINFTTDIFRVQVQGKAATNIRWTASFVGNMTKWT